MVSVRTWRTDDLPYLERCAFENAWRIMPEDDRAAADPKLAEALAVRSLHAVLQAPGSVAFIAEDDGRPIGYLLVAIDRREYTGRPYGYLADIYVDPSHRGMGVAARLHRAAEDHLRALGIREMQIWTHAHNPQGQASAQKRGFRLWGTMMTKHLRAETGTQAEADVEFLRRFLYPGGDLRLTARP